MSINIGPPATDELRPKIMVIGVGGAGGNAIANMIAAEIEGVDFIVANTDAQALSNASADKRIQLGPDITGGLGAGARPEVGKAAAEETVGDIEDALEGVNMCFIAAGMGGGTGTGAAPVIAEAARRKGVLTVGVVTKPFLFEGTRRMRAAEAGIEELQKHVDTLIVIPNQNLFLVAKAETTFKEAFMLADEVLQQGVRSITDLMVMPGLINLDFADVRSVMQEMGKAMMGTGEGEGENRALEAAERAIANPLLDGVSMAGAKGVIISIIGGEDMKLLEVDEAANHIRELVDEDANIIWGSAFNPDLQGKIRVSVVATGIDGTGEVMSSETRSFSLGASRAPKRPVLELPAEDEFDDEDSFEPTLTPPAEPETYGGAAEAGDDELVLSSSEEADERAPLDLAALGGASVGDVDEADEDAEDYDDVDGIVDPLAGLRNEADDDAEDERSYGDEDWGNGDEADDAAPLDLTAEAPTPGIQDDLLGDADRLAEQDEPVKAQLGGGRRRGLVSGGAGEGAAPSAGSTLFERMANLSRGGAKPDEDEDDEDDSGSSSLSIPRFLGRQNNQ
ncbi:Cell division protein FtsZ [Tsuneonella dongtanensis]|uniref:Cell division protein FtsZ n=1 Tax=Tsuneonella dongtanensis TaxID=692370 RepID=A0A1B2AD97_9SPHN|nr:cell division protein FtsZ [Tsuneonella dongtanensis]ANY20025.1 Cell division protein FtsZ [Tsuneonella dongtanensis]